MPQEAWSPKRERQYKHIKEEEKERGRSEGTAERIAAATVNRTRTAKGETKEPKFAGERAQAQKAARTARKRAGSMRRGGTRKKTTSRSR
ncbi:MAG TPA: plasmid stabilization protein [Candidatus Limnocylindria bacterium]|nr:plasmid stabilization protein [Candidatus Limnocylindria bacterium]